MTYTPEMSFEHSCTLRRIAWALNVPMAKAMAHILDFFAEKMDSNMVCTECRDNTKCED